MSGRVCGPPVGGEGCQGAAPLSWSGSLGHVIARLLSELPTSVSEELIERGRVLDTFYIPSRYPNSHPEGAPFEHYGPLQSGEAIQYASEIIEFVRNEMARREGGG